MKVRSRQILKGIFILMFVLIRFVPEVNAVSGISVANGNWNNSSTWSFSGVNRIPTCGDTVTIPSGKVVTLTSQTDLSSCNVRLYIVVGGVFQFSNGNKLSLSCNSQVRILSNGVVKKSTAGGGNSTFIEICGTIEWKAGDGDLPGPALLGTYTLPISLAYFNAKSNNETVDLSWLTASEINNDYFTVERSVDGIYFEGISIVEGSGNSSIEQFYSETDINPLSGLSYYRLKQTDYDGKYSYSQIVSVNFRMEESFKLISIHSNGTELSVVLNNEISGNRTVSIQKMDGQIALNQNIEANKGIHKYEIHDCFLVPGIYVLNINDVDQLHSKMFVQR